MKKARGSNQHKIRYEPWKLNAIYGIIFGIFFLIVFRLIVLDNNKIVSPVPDNYDGYSYSQAVCTPPSTPSPTKKAVSESPVFGPSSLPLLITPTPTKQTMTVRQKILLAAFEAFGIEHIASLDTLIFRESSYNPQAINPKSGSCGLFQAYPCAKMNCQLSDVDCQLQWGVSYIKNRYTNPTIALSFHKRNGWY